MGKIKLPDTEYDESAEFLREYDWDSADITPNMVLVSEQDRPPVYTLEYNGIPFAPLGGIHALTGKSGNGKTMTFTLMIAALLGADTGALRRCLTADVQCTVLYVDTEMERSNTNLVRKRIYTMLGWQFDVEHEELRIMNLREEVTAVNRWRKVLKAINVFRPTVVFVDGLLDIVEDFNKNDQCQQIIYECMATASLYGASMWSLVHQNPGGEKMVGHLGSMLERKATDVFKTTKEKQGDMVTFTVKQIKARGEDVGEITFYVDKDASRMGMPRIVSGDASASYGSNAGILQPQDADAWAAWVRQTISSQYGISTKDLVREVKYREKVGQKRAYEIIEWLEAMDYISRDEKKTYHISHGAVQTEAFNTPQSECPY